MTQWINLGNSTLIYFVARKNWAFLSTAIVVLQQASRLADKIHADFENFQILYGFNYSDVYYSIT